MLMPLLIIIYFCNCSAGPFSRY